MTSPTAGRINGEVIQLAPPAVNDPLAKWQPVEGPETRQLLRHLALSEESSERLKRETLRILSRAIPPTAQAGEETGLVVGHVQSGKTMSFTTLAALAR